MMNELLNICPICGNNSIELITKNDNDHRGYRVQCTKCGARTFMSYVTAGKNDIAAKDKAVHNWNENMIIKPR